MYMIQRDVPPQEQSLCFTVQRRQSQYSHQIHLRWFTSSTKSVTIQMRISVRDTLSNVWRPCGSGNGPGGPTSATHGPKRRGRSRHRGAVPARNACGLEGAAAPADPAREEADQPDECEHRGHDEQPLDDEPGTESDDRQDRKNHEKQHVHFLLTVSPQGWRT